MSQCSRKSYLSKKGPLIVMIRLNKVDLMKKSWTNVWINIRKKLERRFET